MKAIEQIYQGSRRSLMAVLTASLLFLSWSIAINADPTQQPPGEQDVYSIITDGDLNDPSIPDLIGGKVPDLPIVFYQAQEISPAAASAAAIDVWYGNTQSFGNPGTPQEWVNILGRVSGASPFTLSYQLNGGAITPLSVGDQPDVGNDPGDNKINPRLAMPGDFNVEIATTSLNNGANTVAITLQDDSGDTTTENVTVNYSATNKWPASYSTDWNGASAVTDDVDVVDGLWEISGNNVKTTEIGFDRLLAIGDMDTWTEYEITVPVTVRSILLDPKIPGNGAGVGLIIRWKGHFDVDGQQPRLGWRRLGALGWYRWDLKGMAGLEMRGHEGKFIGTSTTRELEFDTRYIFKLSVQSSPEPDKNAYYRLKFWPSSEPEPAKWGIEGFGKDGELTSGSMLLVANNADVTFGNATVVPLSDISSTLNTSVASTDSVGAGILGQNPDGKTTFAYGERVVLIPVPDEGSEFAGWSGDYTGIGTGSDNRLVIFMTKNINVTANFAKGTPKTLTVNVLGDGTVVKSPDKSEYAKDELVELTAVPGPGQALASWSGDIEGNINPITVLMNSNKTITANFDVAEVVPPPLSDDFNACTLNTELWSFQNPLDDGDYTTDGTQATLIVPEGVKHDPWSGSGSSRTNNAIRIMQDADNSDFVIETKLTSQLDGESANQIVGILVEDDTDTFLRFDLYTDGAISDPDLKSFIGYLDNGAPAVKKSGRDDDFDGMPSYSALYLRVERVGDNWTFSYRFDDGAWVVVKTVTQVLAAKKVGVFAGNATLSPELIAVFDYFFNTAAPTTPEDAKGYELVVNTEGQGTVAKSPDNGAYACGEEVTLTATPANGWKFAGWSGAINGLTNPQDLALDMGTIVNARFEEDGAPGEEYTLAVQTVGGGSVVKSPNKPSYQSGDKVTLTATANSGWRFVSWSGGISGAINPYVLEITTNTTVVAAFEQESTTPDQYTLIATTNGAGTVSMVPEKPTYNSGEKVQLTATPAEGWVFNGWTGDLPTGVDNQLPTIQVTMSQDRTLTAHFKGESSDMDIYLPFITKK